MKGELSNLLFRGIKCKYCKKKQIVTTRTQFLLICLSSVFNCVKYSVRIFHMLTVIRTRHYSEREFYFALQRLTRDESRHKDNGRTAGNAGACTLHEILQ